MPAASWDQSSNDLDDNEYPEADLGEEESTDTITCPACGAEIYEDADVCPVCGEFVIPETSIWRGKPTWWIALGILGIIALATALVVGF